MNPDAFISIILGFSLLLGIFLALWFAAKPERIPRFLAHPRTLAFAQKSRTDRVLIVLAVASIIVTVLWWFLSPSRNDGDIAYAVVLVIFLLIMFPIYRERWKA